MLPPLRLDLTKLHGAPKMFKKDYKSAIITGTCLLLLTGLFLTSVILLSPTAIYGKPFFDYGLLLEQGVISVDYNIDGYIKAAFVTAFVNLIIDGILFFINFTYFFKPVEKPYILSAAAAGIIASLSSVTFAAIFICVLLANYMLAFITMSLIVVLISVFLVFFLSGEYKAIFK